MTIQEMFEKSVSRANRWHTKGLNEWSALEWAGAMAGEAGECCNAAKKLKRLESEIQSINVEAERHYTDQEAARLHIAKEACDTIWYALLVMARVGLQGPERLLADVFNDKSLQYGFPEMFEIEDKES